MKNLPKVKDEVCKFKPLFDSLQKKELSLLPSIDVTRFFSPQEAGLKIYLRNQVVDPDLGIHDFLKVEGQAEFTHVVISGKIMPIEDVYPPYKETDKTSIELSHVMASVTESRKQISYFVAQGDYDGQNGVHFCLVPYNDTTSCSSLELLLQPDVIMAFKNPDTENIDEICQDLDKYINSDGKKAAENLFVKHFKNNVPLNSRKNFGLILPIEEQKEGLEDIFEETEDMSEESEEIVLAEVELEDVPQEVLRE